MTNKIIALFFFFQLLLFKTPLTALADVKVNTFRVTFGGQAENWPAIYKDNIYWVDTRGGIYGYDIKNKKEFPFFKDEQPLTDLFALIDYDGRYIVYNRYDGSSYNVSIYDTFKKQDIAITEGSKSRLASDFDGRRVVYIDGYATGDLYVYDIRKKEAIFIASKASVPKIDGRYVVWYIGTGGGLYDIKLYDLIGKKLIDIPNPENGSRGSPDIFGDNVIYIYGKDGANSVRLFDISKNIEAILTESSSYDMSWPSISRRYAVWGKNTAQHISGVEGIDLLTKQVFEIQEQGPHQNDNMSPIIKDNIVAWFAWRTGNGDIYASALGNKPLMPKFPNIPTIPPFPILIK